MKLAIHYSNYLLAGDQAPLVQTLVDTARAADEGGISQMTLMDHYFQIQAISPRAEDPMLEGYTTLGFLAGQTRNLTLGLLVTGVTYRHPGLLAKIVATLDVLSRGRAQLGIGAAWFDREHEGLGVPYPPVSERFERLEEAIQICRQMWSTDNGPYHGKHYQLAETLCSPAPVQKPGPPILIGGMGEQKTLRLVARYGDACNFFASAGYDQVARRIELLRGHCEAEGTDFDRIEKTILGGPNAVTDTDAFLREMERYAKIGVGQVWNGPAGPDPAGWVRQAAEQVVPRLREL
jgi:F420-dependent oxidoreductase-like protein